MKTIIIALSLLISISAWADTLRFQWEKVLTDNLGEPVQELSGYVLYISNGQRLVLPPDITVYDYTQNKLGSYTAYLTAMNSAGESLPSNEVSFTVGAKKPLAPQKFILVKQTIGPVN